MISNNLDHTQPTVVNYSDLERVLPDLDKEVDSGITKALNEMGIQVTDDPRRTAVEVLNQNFGDESKRGLLMKLIALGWCKDEDLQGMMEADPVKIRDINIAGLVLDPKEISDTVSRRVLLACLTDQELVKNPGLLTELEASNPTLAYIDHMDVSRHGKATLDTTQSVLRANGLSLLESPYVEVASGPGNITWQMMTSRIIADDPLLVDLNGDSIVYAIRLFAKRFPNASALWGDATRMGHSANSMLTALAIQWMSSPEGVATAMRDTLMRNGTLVSVGESPVNATAATPWSIAKGLDIGYSGGHLGYNGACRVLERAGLTPMPKASIQSMRTTANPDNIKDVLKLDDNGHKLAKLLRAYSDHTMVATSFKKVN